MVLKLGKINIGMFVTIAIAIILILGSLLLLSPQLVDPTPDEENPPQHEDPPLDENHTVVSFEHGNQEYLNITCEIANTPEARATGLMNREELPMDQGMLFVLDDPQIVSFWMKNTLIPLDLIFIDENSIVTNVEEAVVETGVPDNELTRYSSNGEVKWVVEINLGLSATYGIGTGTTVLIQNS